MRFITIKKFILFSKNELKIKFEILGFLLVFILNDLKLNRQKIK